MVELERPIAIGPDDGDVEPGDSAIYNDEPGLWLTEDVVSIWLRFQNITIPKGATILSAQVRLQSRDRIGGSSGSFQTRIYAIAQDDHTAPANFSQWNTHHNNHTDAFADWNFSMVAPGNTVLTSNFAEAVQEVVDRPGWEPGNAIGIHIDAFGSTANRYQIFQSYEGGVPPVLVVVYEEGGANPVSIEAEPVSAIGAVQPVLTAISQAIQSVPVLGSLLAQPVSPNLAALNVPAVPSLLRGAVQPVSLILDAKSIASVPVLTSGDVQPVLPVMGTFSLEAAPALGQGNVQPLQLALTGVGIPAAPVVANGDAAPVLLGLGELRFASLSASLIGSSQPVLIRGGVVTIQVETVASSLVALAGQLGLGSLSLEAVPVLGQGEVRTVQPVSSEEPTLVTAEVAGVTGLSVPADVLLSPFSLLATPVQGLAAPQPVTLQLAERLITVSPVEGQAIVSPIGVSLSELRIPGFPADASLQGMPTLIILDGKIIALVSADGVAEAVATVVRSSELLIQAVVNARFVRQEAEGSFNRTVVPTRFGRIIVLGYKEPD